MCKKLLIRNVIILLVVSLALFMTISGAEEVRTVTSGQWKYILEDGGAKITGYVEEPSGDLEIPGELDGYPVTSIDEMVFWRCTGLTSVIIPDSVTSIGLWAFDECENLTTVVIPDSVTRIGNWAFVEWYDKLTLRVQEGSYAEQYAEENGIPYVLAGSWASMVIDDEEFVDEEEFFENDEEERTDASGQWTYVLENGSATIWRCEVEPSGHLVIPSELDGCSVAAISDEALWGYNNVTGVTIPDSVTSIGVFTFVECGSLLNIDVSNNNPAYGQMDGVLFDKSLTILISYPAAREGAYTIPEGVTQIKSTAFNDCKNLTGVTIPATVSFIGEDPFYGCEEIILTVQEGSYAEQYAKENDLRYIFTGTYAEPPHREKVTLKNNQTINIRSGPGTQFQQIGEVYPGASFYFTGVVENDFYQILYPDIKNNPQYTTADVSSEALCTIAYVMRSLADVSSVNPDELILSSLVGNLKAKPRAQIYLDEALSKKATGAFSDENCIPFAGIAPSGAYAVLFERANSKGEQVLWIGFISPGDVDAESRLFAVEAAVDDEEDSDWVVRTDASGR